MLSNGMRQSCRTIEAVSVARIPSLCSSLVTVQPGRPRFHHEGPHPGPPGRRVDRRPDHDETLGIDQRLVPGRDEDLLPVEHPLVAIAYGGGANHRRHGRPGVRLGQGHGIQNGLLPLEPGEEALLLLRSSGSGHRRRTQHPDRRTQVQTRIAPRKDFGREGQPLVTETGSRLLRRTSVVLLLLLSRDEAPAPHLLVGFVHERHVIPGHLVFVLVEVPRHRAHHVVGDHRHQGDGLLDLLRHLKADHGCGSF